MGININPYRKEKKIAKKCTICGSPTFSPVCSSCKGFDEGYDKGYEDSIK